MKNIKIILEDKNVKIESLPSNIQSAIENSINLFEDIQTLNETLTEESTEKETEELNELKETHEDFNEQILGAIENFQKEVELKKKVQNEKKSIPEPTPSSEVLPIINTEPKKKGIGFGTFVLGAVVLIATAGAVNMMRNKN